MSLQLSGRSSHLEITVLTFSVGLCTVSHPGSISFVHFISVVSSCDQWYQLMVGQLLFCSPLLISSDYDLHFTAEVCVLQTLPLLAHHYLAYQLPHHVLV